MPALLICGGMTGKHKASVLDKDQPATKPAKVKKHLNVIATIDLTIPKHEPGVIFLFSQHSEQLTNKFGQGTPSSPCKNQ
jgi:hypothetical protein